MRIVSCIGPSAERALQLFDSGVRHGQLRSFDDIRLEDEAHIEGEKKQFMSSCSFIGNFVTVFRVIIQKPPAAFSLFKDAQSTDHSLVVQLMQPFNMY